MALIDPVLHTFVVLNGFSTTPYGVILLGFFAAYLAGLAVERIPFTRRIIERREAAAREGGR
ncbi:hypothetical protein [Spongiactinospora sp. TRM90649]|uniref:hypothetical protein n=1 Tax=Spongiactinospora sp. TRM90649 TaxID=3031114 RepID=UPI0023F66912|nr:hypothetical protein [Spongiactinospora sp. TRM90649]MDF5751325.1 hypothetical protein [Spongiactinospora sp. TRM90649]